MTFLRGDPNRPLVIDCPEEIAGLGPICCSYEPVGLLEEFVRILESANDEKPLQQFFERNPIVLVLGLVQPHRAWVIPRPSLPNPTGGGWIPDFIVCEWSSLGPQWIIVELESPRKNPITKRGTSQICNHGIGQINSYKTYLRDHAHILRENGRWPRLHGECDGALIIGRRGDANRSEAHERLAEFRRQNIEVMSYDRLMENLETNQRALPRRKPDEKA